MFYDGYCKTRFSSSQQNYITHSLTTTLDTTIANHTIHNTSSYHKISWHIFHHNTHHCNQNSPHYILSQQIYILLSLATTPQTTIANLSTHNTSSNHNSINHFISPQHPALSFLTTKVHITFVHHSTPHHVLLLQNFSSHSLRTTMHNTFSQHPTLSLHKSLPQNSISMLRRRWIFPTTGILNNYPLTKLQHHILSPHDVLLWYNFGRYSVTTTWHIMFCNPNIWHVLCWSDICL